MECRTQHRIRISRRGHRSPMKSQLGMAWGVTFRCTRSPPSVFLSAQAPPPVIVVTRFGHARTTGSCSSSFLPSTPPISSSPLATQPSLPALRDSSPSRASTPTVLSTLQRRFLHQPETCARQRLVHMNQTSVFIFSQLVSLHLDCQPAGSQFLFSASLSAPPTFAASARGTAARVEHPPVVMNAASRNSSPGFEILEDFPLPNSQVPPSQPVLSQPTVEDAQLTLADMRRLARGRVRPQPLTCTFVTDGVPCVAVLLCVDGLEKVSQLDLVISLQES